MKLSGNTILITGGTSGIGYELGKILLAQDNKVILLGRSKEKLQELKQQGFEIIACDLENQEDIENAVVIIQNQFPDLNMLFNNAGVQHNYMFTETAVPPHRIRQELEINVTGQMILTQLLIPVLSTVEKAMIVNTTSGLGAFPKTDGLVYSASKAAMRNFTSGLRIALKKTNIAVSEFIPPVTDTGMTRGRGEKKLSAAVLVKKIMPQLKKEKKILTVPAMRMFLWIAFLFPGLANKILSKK
ncbi:MAG TPA: SDR family NAD(P)-dependent oxidoreductase [Chitinophagaceae bacterium]|nr:SDR family NAD(P)-dependent oxidoreductase [Chitinophagaceae bacterium]MCB9055084.1 SDR family NAD(P)-dependent oxidoreductase [Chitinophagales bacterium]HPG09951.1 SDR family NAD(P)-dependent oxidoreductase [Chitinophagaceae bacterium]HRX93110.1 SDR family NAD(P)-dependent oxidoreductase [Chitinophagaceae bacterium]